jgi:hypothetical protein
LSAPATIANDIIDDEMMMSEEKFMNETKEDKNYNVDEQKTKKKQLIVSGRDDVLLKLLADKMNFKFEYIDVKKLESNENVTMAGALGLQMLQRRVRHASYCVYNLFSISFPSFHSWLHIYLWIGSRFCIW